MPRSVCRQILFPQQGESVCRIPSLAIAPDGAILAIAQFRKGSRHDFGHESNIVMRRSTDGGETWSEPRVLVTRPGCDHHNGPVVVDHEARRVILFFRRWSATFTSPRHYLEELITRKDYWRSWGLGTFYITSEDGGNSWSPPRRLQIDHLQVLTEIRAGNGINGIQLSDGTLVVQGCYESSRQGSPDPADVREHSILMISRDHGESWQAGPEWETGYAHQEYCLAQIAPDRLYINQRTRGPYRKVSILDLGTGRIIRQWDDMQLPEPVCHASAVAGGAGRLLFCNPAVANHRGGFDAETRHSLTVRLSCDSGQTWPHARLLTPDKSGYSALAFVPETATVFCLYETGPHHYNDSIAMARFPMTWLTEGGG